MLRRIALFTLYWAVALAAVSVMFISMDYPFPRSVILATAFFPGTVLMDRCLENISSMDRKTSVLDIIYVVSGVMVLEIFLVILCHLYFMVTDGEKAFMEMEPLFVNPVFLGFILSVLSFGQHYVSAHLLAARPRTPEHITFTSNYRKVTLLTDEILYVESRDTDVLVHARDGNTYRSSRTISRWENILDRSFIRIHRSFLVNRSFVSCCGTDSILCGDTKLPVSRKYKEHVRSVISPGHR